MLGRAFGVMHLWGSGGREEQGAVTGWNGLESHEEEAADQPGQEGVLPEGVLPDVLLAGWCAAERAANSLQTLAHVGRGWGWGPPGEVNSGV